MYCIKCQYFPLIVAIGYVIYVFKSYCHHNLVVCDSVGTLTDIIRFRLSVAPFCSQTTGQNAYLETELEALLQCLL